MKKATLILAAAALMALIVGCNAEEKALEKAAPPTKDGAQAPAGGGVKSDAPELTPDSPGGPQSPAEKPSGM